MIHTPPERAWSIPLWFADHDGAVRCATGCDDGVVDHFGVDPTVCFDIATVRYRGVRDLWSPTVEPDGDKDFLRDIPVATSAGRTQT